WVLNDTTDGSCDRAAKSRWRKHPLLEEQRAKTDALKRKREMICPWVFHRQGKPIRTFRRSWKTACRDAGVPRRRNLVRAGVPEAVAMKMTGHKTRSVFERYNIVSEGDLFDAAKRLDAAAGKVSHFQRVDMVKSAGNSLILQSAPVAQ